MMKKALLSGLICALLILLIHVPCFAQSTNITNGLNYLTSTQNADGAWSGDTSNADVLHTTGEVIETFKVLNQTSAPNYSNALLWLQTQSLDATADLSERIQALSVSGTDLNLLISYIDELKRAWGGYDDFEVNNLDTACSLQALKAINYTDQTAIQSAVSYLLSTQNTDGGWGFYQGDESNVYMTAIASITMQQFSQTASIATALNKATTYLIAHQNTGGGFGNSPSTVHESAYAYIALIGVTTDNSVLGNAANYIKSSQSANGSWNDDPYSSALALRALYYSENKPAPPPNPTTGTVTGTVVDASTNQALFGVSVTLQSAPSISTITDTKGSFSLTNNPQGSQLIQFSLSGYATSTATVNVAGGSVIDLGTISLYVNQAKAIIKGLVKDTTTG